MGKPKTQKDMEVTTDKGATCPQDITTNNQERGRAESQLPESLQLHLDKVLAAITASREVLEQKIQAVVIDVNLLRADQSKLADKVKDTETSLKEIQPVVAHNDSLTKGLVNKVEILERKMEDLEGRSRRSNIRVIGIPEGVRGDMMDYLEEWLQTEVAPEGLSRFFAIERAHRVPARRPPPGQPPRVVIAKILHFRDRDLILRMARKHGPYTIENSKVSIFPDYTLSVQKQQASFLAVKRELRNAGIQYALLFPARLRLMLDGESHFYSSPQEAWDWLEVHRAGEDARPSQNDGIRGTQLKKLKRRRTTRMIRGPSRSQTAKTDKRRSRQQK